MSRWRKLLTLAVIALVVALSVLVLPRMRVSMALTHFLPDGNAGELEEILHALAESDLARTSVVDLSLEPTEHGEAADAAALVALGQRFVTALAQRPSIERVQSGLAPGDDERTMRALTAVPPSAFLPASEFERAAMANNLSELKERLGGPMGPLFRALAPADPLGARAKVLLGLRQRDGKALQSEGGILLSAEGDHAFLFVNAKGSAFDADTQRGFLRDLDEALEQANAAGGRRGQLALSSVAKYTVASEQAIRGDIERIGTLSTVGILLLFALFFRSVRLLFLCMVPLLFGTALATILCFWIFGEVHGITLAFGSSLLGVGIDYAEHYFSHFALTPERGADRVMREVRGGLGTGALTTMAGLAGIAWADFPGAQELAVFACLSVALSAIGTIWLLPPWMPQEYRRPSWPAALERRALALLGWLRARRAWRGLLVLGVLVAALGLFRLRFADDVAILIEVDPTIADEDAAVRARVTRADPGKFVVIVSPDREQALRTLEATTQALAQAQRDGLLDHYTALGELLRSEQSQRESYAAARRTRGELSSALREAGFSEAAFEPYFRALDAEQPPLLRLEDLADTPLASLLTPLSPKLGERQAFLVPVGAVHDPAALAARVEAAGALYVDETELLTRTFTHVRMRVSQLVLVSLAVMLGALLLRYRRLRVALTAFVPALLAALLTVATLSALGVTLNVLHGVGVVLVLAMGVDFGVFVAEGHGHDEEIARALVGIFTATLTTLLSFGLLALSQSPALAALGSTTTLGLWFCMVICPFASVWLQDKRSEASVAAPHTD